MTAVTKLKTLAPWKKSYDKPRQHIKKQRHYFANKGLSSQSYCFSSSHVWMWELDYKESWAPKIWCFWTWCWRRLESPLGCKEIQPVHPKGNGSWMFTGRTDAEAETSILCHLMQRTDSLEKILMLRKIKCRRMRMRWLDGITDSMDMGLSELLGLVMGSSLVCCSPWGRRRDGQDWATELNWILQVLFLIILQNSFPTCSQFLTIIRSYPPSSLKAGNKMCSPVLFIYSKKIPLETNTWILTECVAVWIKEKYYWMTNQKISNKKMCM